MSIVGIVWRVLVVVAFGYLLGGVPFGVIVARRMHGVDITKLGSGNTGSTNVFRSLGWRPALIVGVLDVAKGAIPAVLAMWLADSTWGMAGSDLLVIAGGVSAMVGHMFSPYFRLRGGKGVATAAGAILVLMPKAFLVLAIIFFGGALLIRIVSVASLLAALAFPVTIVVLYPDRPVLLVFAVAALLLVFWAHRTNIRRLMRGEEPRVTMGRGAGRKGSD